MSDHVDDAHVSPAAARGTNFTPGKPRWCSSCGKHFDSGNQLHAHLKYCNASPAPKGHDKKSDAVSGCSSCDTH